MLNEIPIPISIYDDDPYFEGVVGGVSHGQNNIDDDLILHLWVDTPPSSVKDAYTLHGKDDEYDNDGDDDQSVKSSKHNHQRKSKREYNPKHSAKKVHPRSHENLNSPEGKRKNSIDDSSIGGGDDNTPLLCKSHFFNGSSKYSNKSNSKSSKKPSSSSSFTKQNNNLYEYNKKLKQKTLFDILVDKKSSNNNTSQNINKKVLEESANAASSAYLQSKGLHEDDNSENNAVQMLYYYAVNLRKQMQLTKKADQSDDNNERSDLQVSDLVSHCLSSEQCPMGACVYVVYKKVLLFDRYMGGVVINKDDHQHLFLDESPRKQISSTNYDDPNGDNNNDSSMKCYVDLKSLPAIVLEHILAFADDEASGVLSQVCKAWHQEIGKTSPALWLNLLSRRNWPIPMMIEEDNDNKEDGSSFASIEETRNIFLNHKKIIRAVDVMFDGIEYLQQPASYDPPIRHTLAIQKFKDNKDTGSTCSGVHMWDDTTMIVAHQKECILSLQKAEKNVDRNLSLSMKEIIHIRVAPFPHSKKTSCELKSIALDNNFVLGFYEVNGLSNWFILLKREELLLNSAESILDRSVFQRYDLVQLLENSCNRSSSMDCISELLTTMDVGFEDVDVTLHSNIVSCGGGFFIFLIDILMPGDDEEGGEETTLDLVARAIVQFSTRSETFSWCTLIPPQMAHVSSGTKLSNFNMASRTIVCTSSVSHPTMILHCEKGGKMNVTIHEEDCRPPLGRWDDSDSIHRQSALSCTHAMFADVLNDEGEENSITTLTFFHLIADQNDNFTFLILKGVDKVSSLHTYGDYCVVVGCRGQTSDHDEFDGHWFGDESDQETTSGSLMIIVHIPSKVEIYRRFSKSSSFSDVTLTFGNDSGPNIFGVSGNKNVAISGQNLRDIKVSVSEKSNKNNKLNKVKKKKRSTKNNKKDGFARGMSLRG